mmetsp:Transcript_28048/g.82484  ORF Transcript_28048/g.82484 Transcript_28048/m.82484 type:complete len:574 (+) Transcript_28048:33-1754(+)
MCAIIVLRSLPVSLCKRLQDGIQLRCQARAAVGEGRTLLPLLLHEVLYSSLAPQVHEALKRLGGEGGEGRSQESLEAPRRLGRIVGTAGGQTEDVPEKGGEELVQGNLAIVFVLFRRCVHRLEGIGQRRQRQAAHLVDVARLEVAGHLVLIVAVVDGVALVLLRGRSHEEFHERVAALRAPGPAARHEHLRGLAGVPLVVVPRVRDALERLEGEDLGVDTAVLLGEETDDVGEARCDGAFLFLLFSFCLAYALRSCGGGGLLLFPERGTGEGGGAAGRADLHAGGGARCGRRRRRRRRLDALGGAEDLSRGRAERQAWTPTALQLEEDGPVVTVATARFLVAVEKVSILIFVRDPSPLALDDAKEPDVEPTPIARRGEADAALVVVHGRDGQLVEALDDPGGRGGGGVARAVGLALRILGAEDGVGPLHGEVRRDGTEGGGRDVPRGRARGREASTRRRFGGRGGRRRRLQGGVGVDGRYGRLLPDHRRRRNGEEFLLLPRRAGGRSAAAAAAETPEAPDRRLRRGLRRPSAKVPRSSAAADGVNGGREADRRRAENGRIPFLFVREGVGGPS